MWLAVAVLLLPLQPAVAVRTPNASAPASDKSPDDRTHAKAADSTVPAADSDSKLKVVENAGAGSNASASAAPIKMDSIYPDGKKDPPNSAGALSAQNSQSFSTIRIADPDAKRYSIREAQSEPSRRNWIILSVLEHSAATFDAYSTRQAVSHGAVEEDPLMRPFAHSPAIYAAIQVAPVLFDLLARHMQRSQYTFERRTWWVPQTASTGMSIFAGVHNLNLKTHSSAP